ncbi:hypothetical protein ACQEXU_11165 [Vibrio sp. TRT 21S02]|uniref:hypothetical protein n=1 Tax=Vibrio sp. TRT 21S02 TaxID=3418507 RepID=UPI003CE89873
MKAMIIVAVLIQIVIAIQSEGLARALAELTAFILVVMLVLEKKKTTPPQSERVLSEE